MRELTFVGFLRRYVRDLSISGTNSVSKLAAEATGDNPRLREPLLLYALFSGKEASLLRSAEGTALDELYNSVLDRYSKEQMLHAFLTNDTELPSAYHKVWRSYMAQKNRKDTDAQTKELMRQRILAMQADKGVSNYRIYKELDLNPGNINDWLKNGAGEKVSLATARRAFEFVTSFVRG